MSENQQPENAGQDLGEESREPLSPTRQPVPAQPIDAPVGDPEQPTETGTFDKGVKVETDEQAADYDAEESNEKE
jgi:hypothetical protein